MSRANVRPKLLILALKSQSRFFIEMANTAYDQNNDDYKFTAAPQLREKRIKGYSDTPSS
jgi:hypothetical protein